VTLQVYQGKVPEKIIGATEVKGQRLFLIEWKDDKGSDLIPTAVANDHWPHMVIAFYEERIIWDRAVLTVGL